MSAFPKRDRFGNTARRVGNHASRLEAAVWQYLYLREKGGEIKDLERQVHVRLHPIKWGCKPDFRYFDLGLQETVYAEAKGVETDRWLATKAIWEVHGPGRLLVFKGSAKSFKLAEEIVPQGAAHG